MKQALVFDIDGTLTLMSDRVKLLEKEPKDWDNFYARCCEDEPNWPVIDVLKAFRSKASRSASSGYRIVLLTGRRESTRQLTRMWLRFYGIEFDHLLMRPDDDLRHDTIVKPEVLKEAGFTPYVVFEDRNSMVEYWRSNGVPCFQVAPGNF